MIKAVFFDFYKTLARFWPPVEEIQRDACEKLGVTVTTQGVLRGYGAADDYFSRENATFPLAHRSEEERDRFFARYEQLILKGAGIDASLDLAQAVWRLTSEVPKGFAPFDDVIPALASLKGRGLTLGLLSNLYRDMAPLLSEMGLAPYLDVCLSAKDVGVGKPHPRMFLAGLERAGVTPAEAVHVGDQLYSDVHGARAVGILPVLLDRDGSYPEAVDCPRVKDLGELVCLVGEMTGG